MWDGPIAQNAPLTYACKFYIEIPTYTCEIDIFYAPAALKY